MPRISFSILLLIVVSNLFFVSVSQAASKQSHSVTDPIRLLYSSRLTFNEKGVPEVGVGLMTGKEEIEFSSQGALKVTSYGPAGKTDKSLLQEAFFIRLLDSKPGKTAFHVVVESLNQNDRANLDRRIAAWKTKGIATETLRVGAILALKGEVINNAMYHLVGASFDERLPAERFAAGLKRKHDITAHIFEQLKQAPSGRLGLLDEAGVLLGQSDNLLFLSSQNGAAISVKNCEHGQGFRDHGYTTKSFHGVLYAAIDRNGKLALGNWLSMEKLLAGTVTSEIFSNAPEETLKAQAVAARGQLLAKLGVRHLADPFHLCATQHCQVYKGADVESETTNAAVDATSGMLLMRDGQLVDTVYSSSCGGHSENNENVWSQPPQAALRGRLDSAPDRRFIKGINSGNLSDFLENHPGSYCASSGYAGDRYRWQRSFTPDEMKAAVNRHYPVGEILEIEARKRGVSGRLKELLIVGSDSTIIVTRELPIRRVLGNLPSAMILIDIIRNETGNIQSFDINGAGFGHGVGLCQFGAIGRAKAGHTFENILKHYYQGAELKKLY